jgi:hypothetical protein
MSHITLRQSYKSLSDRLNLFPQGAPPTELLFRILQVLFTEEEAALVAPATARLVPSMTPIHSQPPEHAPSRSAERSHGTA